jgi:hypothetical protein
VDIFRGALRAVWSKMVMMRNQFQIIELRLFRLQNLTTLSSSSLDKNIWHVCLFVYALHNGQTLNTLHLPFFIYAVIHVEPLFCLNLRTTINLRKDN